MTEVELAKKFIEYFSDYEIYNEVYGVDFIVCKDPVRIGVEVKTRLNFKVIEQAARNRRICHYSYIAVPFAKRGRSFQGRVCKKFGVGILEYSGHAGMDDIWESLRPKLNRSARKVELKDYMKESVAGAPASAGTTMTAWKNTVRNMSKIIKRKPGISMNDCLKEVDHHYSSFSGAKSSMYSYLRGDNPVIKDFRLENGKLFVNK